MKIIKLGIVALALLLGTVQGAIVNVPGDQPTIQAGINAAANNDTVLVEHGTYVENVKVLNKWPVLASRYIIDGDTEHIAQTIIDGSNPTSSDTGSCIILLNSIFGVVQGFTLTGGIGTNWFDPSDNKTYREGGGVLVDGGNPKILNNLIIRNDATQVDVGITSAGGGAIRVGFGSAEIRNNVIAFNRGLYGGGAVIFNASAIVTNNVIYRNSGGQDFGGGGLWLTSGAGSILLENNTIVENSSTLDGGGVLIWNKAVDGRNNIIRDNIAVTSGPDIRLRAGGSFALTYSDVEGGFAGTGNIDQLPLFGSVNYYLTAPSPCVDAGDPGASYNDVEDSGNPGFALPPSLGLLRNDQGAYGGPEAAWFPAFNAATLATDVSAVQFDTLQLNASDTAYVEILKSGFGAVSVDSVRNNSLNVSVTSSAPNVLGPLVSDSLDSLRVIWTANNSGALVDTVKIYYSGTPATSPLLVALSGMAAAARGDVNNSGSITSADIIYLVGYVFKGGPPPFPVVSEGDVNCTGSITSSDIIYLVNYVFKGGAAPC
jgi:hypothetical protein